MQPLAEILHSHRGIEPAEGFHARDGNAVALRELLAALDQMGDELGHGIEDLLTELVAARTPAHCRLLHRPSVRGHGTWPLSTLSVSTVEWLNHISNCLMLSKVFCLMDLERGPRDASLTCGTVDALPDQVGMTGVPGVLTDHLDQGPADREPVTRGGCPERSCCGK